MTPAVWPWCYHHDSTVQYRILYPSSTPLSLMNLLSPGMLGFFVDQVSGKDQAAWTDTPHLRPGYVRSVFDRSRTYPMVLLGGGLGVTGPMTEAVIGGLNTAHVTLGVVLVPWSTVTYEHATIGDLGIDDRRSMNVTIQSVGLRFQEPEFGFAVSGGYGWASTEGVLRRDKVDVTVSTPATYYASRWGCS